MSVRVLHVIRYCTHNLTVFIRTYITLWGRWRGFSQFHFSLLCSLVSYSILLWWLESISFHFVLNALLVNLLVTTWICYLSGKIYCNSSRFIEPLYSILVILYIAWFMLCSRPRPLFWTYWNPQIKTAFYFDTFSYMNHIRVVILILRKLNCEE